MNTDNYLQSDVFLKRKKTIPDDKLIGIIGNYIDLSEIKKADLYEVLSQKKIFRLNGIEIANNFISETEIRKSSEFLLNNELKSQIYRLSCIIALQLIKVRANNIKWSLIKFKNDYDTLLKWQKELEKGGSLVSNIDLPMEILNAPLKNLSFEIEQIINSGQSKISNKLMWKSLKKSLNRIFERRKISEKVKMKKYPVKSFQEESTKEQKAAIIGCLIIIAKSDGGTDDHEINLLEKFAKFIDINLEDPIITDQISGGRKLLTSRLNSMSQKNKEWFAVAGYEMGICNGVSDDEQINVLLSILDDIGISEDKFVDVVEKSKQLYNKFVR